MNFLFDQNQINTELTGPFIAICEIKVTSGFICDTLTITIPLLHFRLAAPVIYLSSEISVLCSNVQYSTVQYSTDLNMCVREGGRGVSLVPAGPAQTSFVCVPLIFVRQILQRLLSRSQIYFLFLISCIRLICVSKYPFHVAL